MPKRIEDRLESVEDVLFRNYEAAFIEIVGWVRENAAPDVVLAFQRFTIAPWIDDDPAREMLDIFYPAEWAEIKQQVGHLQPGDLERVAQLARDVPAELANEALKWLRPGDHLCDWLYENRRAGSLQPPQEN